MHDLSRIYAFNKKKKKYTNINVSRSGLFAQCVNNSMYCMSGVFVVVRVLVRSDSYHC